jgi:hypothetical protein
MIATAPTLPMAVVAPTAATPAHRRSRRRRSLAITTVVGAMALVAAALVGSSAPPMVTAREPVALAVDARATVAIALGAVPSDADTSDAPALDAGAHDGDATASPTRPEPAPITVEASDLTRLASPAPRSRSTSARYRARLCIGIDGAVRTAIVLDGPARLFPRIARTLARWRYRPYRDRDGPRPVCFDVTARTAHVAARTRNRVILVTCEVGSCPRS